MSDLDHGPMYCMGRNCGTTTAQHSPECILETAIIQGWSTEATLAAAKAVFDASATLSPAHIEDGEEVEVVGYRVSMPGEPELGTWLDEAAEEEPQIQRHEPLMTVAQHQRIVAALKQDLAYFPPTVRALTEKVAELRAALSAPPAAGVPGDSYLESCAAAAKMFEQLAPTPPASEQQRAVVMPERKAPFEGADGPPDWRPLKNAEVRGWNACVAEFLRLNPHLAKGEGV